MFGGRTPRSLLHLVRTGPFRACPLLPGRGAHLPCILGRDGGATLLHWHLGRGGRPSRPYWFLGQADGPARLHRLPGHALPSVEREGSRLLQGRTNTCQRILVLQDVPLDIIVIIVVAVSGSSSNCTLRGESRYMQNTFEAGYRATNSTTPDVFFCRCCFCELHK